MEVVVLCTKMFAVESWIDSFIWPWGSIGQMSNDVFKNVGLGFVSACVPTTLEGRKGLVPDS